MLFFDGNYLYNFEFNQMYSTVFQRMRPPMMPHPMQRPPMAGLYLQ